MADITVDVMHCSMQFSDSTRVKQADAKKILERAARRKVWWITGTEAGMGASADLRKALEKESANNGYRFRAQSDVWISVRRDLIEPKSWDTGWIKTLESGTGSQNFSDRGLLWASWDDTKLNVQVNVGVSHYMTHGRKKGDEYYVANTKAAKVIGDWGREHGARSALAFYGGDQNIPDRTDDTFRGQPFTSLADELKDWENTGHGSIDVIASYDADKRVKGKYWRVLDDREFPLGTDHFACEGGFTVKTR